MIAFGTSVGNERVGLYSAFNARGFSPVQAGNVRIEGLYFDYQADLNDRLVQSSTVRVGLTALGYPFPAPTGIADFTIRKPGEAAVLSAILGYGPLGSARVELDGQLPLGERFGVAGGVGALNERLPYGGDRRLLTAAATARWRPSSRAEVTAFWNGARSDGQEAQPIVFTAGPYLPPVIPRGTYFGQDWARNASTQANYGLLGRLDFSGWQLRAGLFRSALDSRKNFVDLALNTTRDGLADRFVLAEPSRRFASTSGELRLTRRIAEGDRAHLVHLAVRARDQRRRFGGGQLVDIGRGRINTPLDRPEPVFAFGPQSRDAVRQVTLGLGYEGRWRGVGEASLGLQKADYRKEVTTPAGPLPVSADAPWLPSGALSLTLTPSLVAYAGFAKGLEESPIAPEVARNKDFAPPAIVTSQRDAGVRWAISPGVRLVAGVFEIRKPYYALDRDRVFGQLGTVTNRGVEVSLAGRPVPNLSVVLGGVYIDSRLTGRAVEQGLVGPRPINSIPIFAAGSAEYFLPEVRGLSFDVGFEATSDRVADRLDTYAIPARYVVNPGVRYRFALAGRPSMLRGQVANLNGVYGFNGIGEGFYYNLPRRYQLWLTMDL